MIKYLQQGDLILRKVKKPIGVKKEHADGLTLARGEHTGNHHTVVGMAEAYIVDDIVYLDVAQESVLTHQEHGKILVSPGTYEVVKVNEYDHFLEESKKVVD